MAQVVATSGKHNLPVSKKTPAFPVDREKLAEASGRPAGSGYQANLENVKKLISAVKVGYTKLVIEEGVQNPSFEQVYEANSADIGFRLSNALGDLRLVDGTSLSLPLINSEQNLLWAYIAGFAANPAVYGAPGFEPVHNLKPIGKDSRLTASQG